MLKGEEEKGRWSSIDFRYMTHESDSDEENVVRQHKQQWRSQGIIIMTIYIMIIMVTCTIKVCHWLYDIDNYIIELINSLINQLEKRELPDRRAGRFTKKRRRLSSPHPRYHQREHHLGQPLRLLILARKALHKGKQV